MGMVWCQGVFFVNPTFAVSEQESPVTLEKSTCSIFVRSTQLFFRIKCQITLTFLDIYGIL